MSSSRRKVTPPVSGDDREIVAAYLSGRGEGAFRALYRRHAPRLYQLALRILGGDQSAAEEAVQETWIRAAEKLDAFAWRSSLATWLAGIAINVCRDRLRRRRARPRPVPIEGIDAPAPGARKTERLETERLDLERAISSLSPRYRQVLVLHDLEGYTHREVSSLLEIEVGTSKSQLFFARKAMRASLGARTRPGAEE